MEGRRLALQDNPLGLQPEQVLVLETIGSIDNFIRAVGKIRGLEWLGEYELDDICPEHGFEEKMESDEELQDQLSFTFEDESQPERKLLKGQLFVVMTDQRALRELCSLFRKWQKDSNAEFDEGLAPWKHVFRRLHTIRPWDAVDRIRETGVLEDWRERLQSDQEVVPFEVELWFRTAERRREQTESQLRNIIASMDGQVIQQCVIHDIAYHAVLGRIHRKQIQNIIDQSEALQDFELLQCEDIMHLRPVGQCAIPITEDTVETDTLQEEPQPDPPQGDPVVALFDGMPLTGQPSTR